MHAPSDPAVRPSEAPPFHRLAFHRFFWGKVIGPRLRILLGFRPAPQPTFASHGALEGSCLSALALVGVILGLGMVGRGGSRVGWGLLVAGGTGLAALLIHSVARQFSEYRERGFGPTWAEFDPVAFLFTLLAAALTGASAAYLRGHGAGGRALGALGGLVVGYLLGALAGVLLPALGWFAGLVRFVLAFACFGLLVLGVILFVL